MSTKIYEHIFEKYDLKVESIGLETNLMVCNNPEDSLWRPFPGSRCTRCHALTTSLCDNITAGASIGYFF